MQKAQKSVIKNRIRIGSPDITQKDNQHVLSAVVSFDSKQVKLPEKMWFAVHGKDPGFIPGLADAFLVSLIVTAMTLGEDIRVEGKVSSCLAHGLINYQRILSVWWPESFSMIDIDYADLVDRRVDQRATGVAFALMDGMNLRNALADLMPENMPNKTYDITHALMINGIERVDDSLHGDFSQLVSKNHLSVLAEWGVEPMMIYTNQEHFRQPVMSDSDQLKASSSALAACAHALAGTIGRFSTPGHESYAYHELEPSGSHPVMDHHLGSDQLQVIHVVSSCSHAKKEVSES